MSEEIKLIKNNDKKDITDLEWIDEFYNFLQGEVPGNISLGKGNKLKLTKEKSFTIIWYLQEHFPILPDHINKCDFCGNLYNSHSDGYYSELKGKHYCDSCFPPFLDERENKILERRYKKHYNNEQR